MGQRKERSLDLLRSAAETDVSRRTLLKGSAAAGNEGGGSTRGGSSEQHAEAGRQSHKNQK